MGLLVLCSSIADEAPAEEGNTFNAATASRTDVLAAIALTSPGDTVVVPAGSVSWAGDIDISGITLKGPGRNAGSPLNVTAGKVNITKHSTHMTTLRGVRFTGSSEHIEIGGSAADEFFRVHDCYLFGDNAHILQIGVNGGLFSECDFENTDLTDGGNHVHLTMGASGGNAVWAAAHTMGTADTDGTANVYFEDCAMTNYRDGFPDVDDGGKCVIRYCTLNDAAIITHGGGSGGSGNDSSQYGARHLEVYNNTFNRVDHTGDGPFNQWVYFRGSSGVVANNVWDDPSTSEYGGKVCIRLGVGNCAAGHPRQYQVGQGEQVADSTPDTPLQIFGNTGTTQTIGVEANPNTTCSNPGTLIQSGRDYVTSQTWWTPYTYPHPLRPT